MGYQRDGVHLEYKPDARKAHDGTIEYTSRDAHIGAHSRRSDLEILAYNLVHWMSGTLPWMDNLTNPQYVHMQKKGFMDEVPGFLQRCFGDADYPSVLEDFLDYVNGLEFDDEPDYDKCRDMFKKALKKAKKTYDGKLDFTMPKSPVSSSGKKVGSAASSSSSMASSPSPKKVSKKRVATSGKRKIEPEDVIEEEEDEEEQEAVVVAKPSGSRKPPKKRVSKAKSSEEDTPKAKKKAAASPRKKKRSIAVQPSEDESSQTEDDQPLDKAVKKSSKKHKTIVSLADKGCQTSPAFVKRARAAKKAAQEAISSAEGGAAARSPEMDEFVSKAISAAKAANARNSPAVARKKSSTAAKRSKAEGQPAKEEENDLSASNPTPAMLALMKKRQEGSAKKTSRR